MSGRYSITIDPKLEENGVFRAAWKLIAKTPTGKKTIEKLMNDGFRTKIVPGTKKGDIARAFRKYQLGKTTTDRVSRQCTVTIEMGLLNAAMLAKIEGELRMLAPHTLTSTLAAIIHHELLHACNRGSETLDKRLDFYQDLGKPAETIWRSRAPEQKQFLNELKFIMPRRRDTSRFNKALKQAYDELLLDAHKPWGPREPLVQ